VGITMSWRCSSPGGGFELVTVDARIVVSSVETFLRFATAVDHR
jgi:hypothetical protein